jgi:Leucine-rich repeat (LRR) protein
VDDLISTYQDLAIKNLEWRADVQKMDAVAIIQIFPQISKEMIVPGTGTPKSTDTPTTETEVIFPDPNLEAAIRGAINKPEGAIYAADLEGLNWLDAPSKEIKNIAGLEHCTNLQTLGLLNNTITDLSPLSTLINLQTLVLDDGQITDISPLSELTNLHVLYLFYNQITDISPL